MPFCIVCNNGKTSALIGEDYCYWHSDSISPAEKRLARARGGAARKKAPDDPIYKILGNNFEFKTIQDAVRVVGANLECLFALPNTVKRAIAINQCCETMVEFHVIALDIQLIEQGLKTKDFGFD